MPILSSPSAAGNFLQSSMPKDPIPCADATILDAIKNDATDTTFYNNATPGNNKLYKLLKDIFDTNAALLCDSDDANNIHPKVATYIGVTISNNVLSYSKSNRNIDKLTFYIMFRLPFSTLGEYSSHYGDPFSGTSWTARANEIRLLAGLKKLNGAGEQVNASGVHVDNSGNDISGYNNVNSYNYYGIDFNNINPGDSAITDVNTLNTIKSLPIFYFLTVYTENKPQGFERLLHLPENTIGEEGKNDKNMLPKPEYSRRRIIFGGYDNLGNFIKDSPQPPQAEWVDGIFISTEQSAQGTRYFTLTKSISDPMISFTFIKYYIKLEFDEEDMSQEIFNLNKLKIVADTSLSPTVYYATYLLNFTGQGDRQYEKIKIPGASGLTFGLGLDIGGAYPGKYLYEIKFRVLKHDSPSGTGFKLIYGSRISAEMVYTSLPTDVKGTLTSLLELENVANKDLITVTVVSNSGVANYSSGWDVIIQRTQTSQPVAQFQRIYLHNIFYHPEIGETTPNVKIVPAIESARYSVRPTSNSAYQGFISKINAFFTNGNWLDPAHHKQGFNAQSFEKAVKLMFGVQNGPAKVVFMNYYSVIRKFQMPPYNELYAAHYTQVFYPNFYNIASLNTLKNSIHSGIAMNAAEKLLFSTISYAAIKKLYLNGKSSNGIDPEIKNAINSHSYKKLRALFIKKNSNPKLEPRRNFLTRYMDIFKNNLYRGVEG